MNTNTALSYRDYRYNQNRVDVNKQGLTRGTTESTCQTTIINHLPPPSISVAGPDLSATLIDLANIQSRSLDIMVANQKSQKDVYNELTRANKDKANNSMFAAIKTYDGAVALP